MALLDRDGREERGGTGEVDRRLLVVALALALLTLLAVLDLHRPVPGSEPPVEVRIPPMEALPLPAPGKPVVASKRIDPDELLAYD
ncbi:hypothetical protein [Azospirillum agricola]|uniref:hypothetical protein n=1 Tax=Azospirillum agricola TaxID=1720247 RepID=UPI000A0F1652|nr:hypothetical protein [Azospirillum agricola]SMH48133.1 hypothetical protein SAMN02982994_2756 [Azospirillum lipoferum]